MLVWGTNPYELVQVSHKIGVCPENKSLNWLPKNKKALSYSKYMIKIISKGFLMLIKLLIPTKPSDYMHRIIE